MFFPFLPFVFALTGLSVMAALPAPAMAAWAPWQGAGAALLLLLPAVLLGWLPERLGGPRSPMRLSRRRMALVVVWLAALETTQAPAALAGMLGGSAAAAEWVVLPLLAHFWLADALCLERFPVAGAQVRPFLRRVRLKMGISMPLVTLVGVGTVLSTGAHYLMEGTGAAFPPWMVLVGGFALYGFLAAIVLPGLIPLSWGLRALENRAADAIIQEELRANGVRVHRVLNWPSGLLGNATAGVIGLVPRFRYLLVAETLAGGLEPDELRSVTAHEAGHVRHGHLWFFFAALFSFLILFTVAVEGLLLAGEWFDLPAPSWLVVVLEVAGLVLFIRFGIGFLSRHFERQADGNAVVRHGPGPFERAILKVARWNGIPVAEDNWHHYGIARRIAFAYGAAANPGALARHTTRVGRIKAACIAALLLGGGAQAVFSSAGVVPYLAETFWISRLEQTVDPSPGQQRALFQLATQAYGQQEFGAAERYFRLLLAWNPADPALRNNLAWLLVTQPRDNAARAGEGLALAHRAARENASAFIWDTLAEALFRNNQRKAALHAASKALSLAEAGRGRGGVGLAYYRSRVADFAKPRGDGAGN